MDSLEYKKTEAEIYKVKGARLDLEARVIELEDNIKRIKENVKVQLLKEEELLQKLKRLEKGI